MDAQRLFGCMHRFKIFATIVPQVVVQTLSDRGLLDHVGVTFELATYCGSNEIGPVRVKAVLYQQIDMTQIDVAEIDRDLICVTRLCPS
jgi:hypothetical protein